MNANLLAIVNRIVAEQGEDILADVKRLFPYFSDYAKDEAKEERVALGRCLEMGAYQELKKTRTADERLRVKTALANQMNAKTGIARPRCVDALDLLEAVIFKPARQPSPPQTNPVFCTNCGSNIKAGAVFCTSCGQAVNGPTQTAGPQNQYPVQGSPPAVKKTKSKAPVIIAAVAAAAVIAVVVIIAGNRNSLPPWEGYVTFEDFARAAEINDILPVGYPLNEKSFYALMGGAFVGSFLEPVINVIITSMGFVGTGVTVTAKVDFVTGSKLSEKYDVPVELRQNNNYLVRRSGIGGSKTYLALRFDGERVFGVSYIPYTQWIVMEYEEGAFIKF